MLSEFCFVVMGSPVCNISYQIESQHSLLHETHDSYLERQVFLIIEAGQIEALKTVLKALSPNELQACRNAKGRTLLHKATLHKDGTTVRMLLQRCNISANVAHSFLAGKHQTGLDLGLGDGVNRTSTLNTRDKEGATPLYLAALRGHLEPTTELLKAGAMVDLSNNLGRTPLHAACEHNNPKVSEMLIRYGATVNAVDNAQWAPLHTAALRGFPGLVQVLLKCENIDVNKRNQLGWAPIHGAARRGHVAVVSLLIEKSDWVNLDLQDMKGWSPLHHAADSGHEKAVEVLLKADAIVNLRDSIQGVTPLHYAAHRGHTKVVRLLLDYGASQIVISNDGWTPLHVACRLRRLDVVRTLLKHSRDAVLAKGRRGWTPLHVAAWTGDAEIARCLLENEAQVSLQLRDTWTPLHLAAMSGRTNALEVLLFHGADPLQQEKRLLLTPLDVAVLFQHTGCAMAILAKIRTSANSTSCFRDWLRECFRDAVPSSSDGSNRLDRLVTELDKRVALEQTRKTKNIRIIDGTRLQSAMVAAGFVQSRASQQSAAADHLQSLIRQYSANNRIHLCGSYAEGWGSSVTRLSGRVDSDSDIDVSEYADDRLYHLSGKCKCNRHGEDDSAVKNSSVNEDSAQESADDMLREQETLTYKMGHVGFNGYAAQPARTQYGCLGRPAMDMALMYRFCAYPDVHILNSPGYLSPELISQLRAELVCTEACPLVGASLPGQEGKQLRVSTKWLELPLVRSFNNVQGQLYIILKYLVKRVINQRGGQLKSFHAKTLAFRMVRETPPDMWRTNRLPELTAMALDKLAQDLEQNVDPHVPTQKEGTMHSFFFPDAPLPLKRSDNVSSADGDSRPTLAAVLDVRERLSEVLVEFVRQLQPLRPNKGLYYHPFMLLPRSKQVRHILRSQDTRQSWPTSAENQKPLEYHELFEYIRWCLRELSVGGQGDSRGSLSALLEDIERLPDCARTTRECIAALAYLRYDQPTEALGRLEKLLLSGHRPMRGLKLSSTDATSDTVQQCLLNNDSAWRFCFVQEAPQARPFRFDFLPAGVIQFPRRLLRYDEFYAANFDALAKSLYLGLLRDCGRPEPDEGLIRGWFNEMLDAEMDTSEIDLLTEHCKRPGRQDLLVRLVLEHKDTLVQSRTVHYKLADVVRDSNNLKSKLKKTFLDRLSLLEDKL